MTTGDLLELHIYPNLDYLHLLEGLSPTDKGNYLLLNCPRCGKKEAYIYKSGATITCNRLNNCGFSISLWDWLKENRGLSNQETLFLLADAANYPLAENTKGNLKDFSEKQRLGNLLQAAGNKFHAYIHESDNPALKYMLERGYSPAQIKDFGVGLFPTLDRIAEDLYELGYSESDFRNSGLTTAGFGTDYLLTIPYKSAGGVTRGFIVRAVNPEITPKYKFSFGLEKDNFFNFDKASGSDKLIIVEGFIDALAASFGGLKNIAATGGAIPASKQIDHAMNRGIKSFILALDNDTAGYNATYRTVENLTNRKIPVFVVEYPDIYKDPDEYIAKSGIDSFKASVRNATPGAVWMTNAIAGKYFGDNDIDRRTAKDKLISFALTLNDSLDIKLTLNKIKEIYELDEKSLEKEFSEFYRRKQNQERNKRYKQIIDKASSLLATGQSDNIKEYLTNEFRDIASPVIHTLDTYGSADFLAEIKNAPAGLSTGYEQIDEIAQIMPGAITIIAGRPRHGKTTFLMNMAMNRIKLNPKKTVFFFSYEEPRKDILMKILSIHADTKISDSQNIKQIEYYLRGKMRGKIREERTEILSALDTVNSYLETNRLKIIDSPLYVDDLTDALRYYKSKYDIDTVFIDYIQKIKIRGKFQSRQIELQKVSEALLECAKELRLPLILGAQFNRDATIRERPKMENLRESGDIENDANLIFGIYNDSVENSGDQFGDIVDFEVLVLKNRNGRSNEKIKLQFNRPKLKISEENDA